MPVVDGRVVRARYTSLKLGEISSVDNPAQPGALASICKRYEPPIAGKGSWLAREVAKYVGCDDGAHTFEEVLAENKFDEAIWPMTDALSQSIRSIMGDSALSPADRDTKITASLDEFLGAVRALDPPEGSTTTPATKIEQQLRELISKKEPQIMKTVEQLEAEVAALKVQVATAQAETATAKTAAEKAEGELATEKTAHGETKKALVAATDETFKVGDREIKKSVAGEDMFAVMKASEDRAQLAVLEKRADSEFPHLPGTTAEKALVLKHVEAMPEEARKTFATIVAAAEKMAAAGFGQLGYRAGGEGNGDVAKAQSDFNGKVQEVAKRDSLNPADAMRKARTEFPTEFAAAYPDQAAN